MKFLHEKAVEMSALVTAKARYMNCQVKGFEFEVVVVCEGSESRKQMKIARAKHSRVVVQRRKIEMNAAESTRITLV